MPSILIHLLKSKFFWAGVIVGAAAVCIFHLL